MCPSSKKHYLVTIYNYPVLVKSWFPCSKFVRSSATISLAYNMESLLKDFELQHKNPSIKALRRWRSAVTLVINHRRCFRMVADLDKRSQAEQIKQGVKVQDQQIEKTSEE
ncbi:hypothetical protein RJT34_03454 [Clitoria ternatea]|uniref:Calcium-transporting P-type ATPase N-terminal autoinhibitory domain-containing protein n=1 Tax=Clitoria ternatea TaxID=43366 RepID=A0AAN9KJU3_CLITE